MALPSFCRETVTVHRAPIISDRGSERRDWSNATSHVIAECAIQPNTSGTDMTEARTADSIRATGYFDFNADVQKGDKVEWRGILFAVDGIPMQIVSATGAVSHLRVNLVEWEG